MCPWVLTARATSTSPRGWKALRAPQGQRTIGECALDPKSDTDMSMRLMSTKRRTRSWYCVNARFAHRPGRLRRSRISARRPRRSRVGVDPPRVRSALVVSGAIRLEPVAPAANRAPSPEGSDSAPMARDDSALRDTRSPRAASPRHLHNEATAVSRISISRSQRLAGRNTTVAVRRISGLTASPLQSAAAPMSDSGCSPVTVVASAKFRS